MRFRLSEPFTPYVRMTQRSKFADSAALRYRNSQACLAIQMREQMALRGWSPFPPQAPFTACVQITMPARLHSQDLDNQVKAVLDAAQGVVFSDDRYLDGLVATRAIGRDYLLDVEFVLAIAHLESGDGHDPARVQRGAGRRRQEVQK